MPVGRGVEIRFDRVSAETSADEAHVFLEGREAGGARVTVELDGSAWATIRREWAFDPLGGVEELSRLGHWRMRGDRLVWRIDLI